MALVILNHSDEPHRVRHHEACQAELGMRRLPDELYLHILSFLDVNDLLAASRVGPSRIIPHSVSSPDMCSPFPSPPPPPLPPPPLTASETSRRLRSLSLDPLLHKGRRRDSFERVSRLLPLRPLLQALQPPVSTIYLTKTHLAARRLHWSLVTIRLNRSLLRRPKLSTLVSANILPKECCRRDLSGEWVGGVSGSLLERKRRVEVEKIKEGLRVWLERKARQIRSRKQDGGVGVLVWRFSRSTDGGDARRGDLDSMVERPDKDKVNSLRRFFEGLGNSKASGDRLRASPSSFVTSWRGR